MEPQEFVQRGAASEHLAGEDDRHTRWALPPLGAEATSPMAGACWEKMCRRWAKVAFKVRTPWKSDSIHMVT